jgi:hypothetical protein
MKNGFGKTNKFNSFGVQGGRDVVLPRAALRLRRGYQNRRPYGLPGSAPQNSSYIASIVCVFLLNLDDSLVITKKDITFVN